MPRHQCSPEIERELCVQHRLRSNGGTWQRLRNRHLDGAKFGRQHPIGPYIADFFCRDARLVIKLDGSQHGEERGRQADERRTEYFENRGYRVLRFWNEEVLDNIDGVLDTIALHL